MHCRRVSEAIGWGTENHRVIEPTKCQHSPVVTQADGTTHDPSYVEALSQPPSLSIDVSALPNVMRFRAVQDAAHNAVPDRGYCDPIRTSSSAETVDRRRIHQDLWSAERSGFMRRRSSASWISKFASESAAGVGENRNRDTRMVALSRTAAQGMQGCNRMSGEVE